MSDVVILENCSLNNDIHLKKRKSLKAGKQLNNCLRKAGRFPIFLLGYCGSLMMLHLLRCNPASPSAVNILKTQLTGTVSKD